MQEKAKVTYERDPFGEHVFFEDAEKEKQKAISRYVEHIVKMTDYISNPRFECKNYVVCDDFLRTLANQRHGLENRDVFVKAKKKFKYLAEAVYGVKHVLD